MTATVLSAWATHEIQFVYYVLDAHLVFNVSEGSPVTSPITANSTGPPTIPLTSKLAPVVGIKPTLTVLETAVLSLYDTDIKFGLPGRIRTDVIPVPKTGAIPD